MEPNRTTPDADVARTSEITAPPFIVGAHHDVRPDRSRNIGVENHENFPVGEWTRLYVPTDRLDEATSALDRALAEDSPRVVVVPEWLTDSEAVKVLEIAAEVARLNDQKKKIHAINERLGQLNVEMNNLLGAS